MWQRVTSHQINQVMTWLVKTQHAVRHKQTHARMHAHSRHTHTHSDTHSRGDGGTHETHGHTVTGFAFLQRGHDRLEHQALDPSLWPGRLLSPPSRPCLPEPRGSGKLSTTLSTLPTSPSSDSSTWSLSQKSQRPNGVSGNLDKWRAREGGKVGVTYVMFTEWVSFINSVRLAAIFLQLMAKEMHHSAFSWK